MSVIYNALKKFHHHPPIQTKNGDAGKKSRQVSIKEFFLSPSGLAGCIVLFFFLSLIFLFGFQDRTREVQANTNGAVIIARNIQAPQAPSLQKESLEASDGRVISKPHPSDNFTASTKPGENTIAQQELSNPATQDQPMRARYLVPGSSDTNSQPGRWPNSSNSAIPIRPSSLRHEDQSGPIGPQPPNNSARHLTPGDDQLPTSVNRQMQASSAAAAVEALPFSGVGGTQTDSAARREPVQHATEQNKHAVRVKSNLEIIRLIQKIKKSIRRGAVADTESFLERLVALKGADDPYVLKLQAYWRLRQRDYEAAALLLGKVLDKDAEDIEAGINMAIVDINCQRIEKARVRLQNLEKRYPDNLIIADLIQKLKK